MSHEGNQTARDRVPVSSTERHSLSSGEDNATADNTGGRRDDPMELDSDEHAEEHPAEDTPPLIPKPTGEAGRSGRGGYCLQKKLEEYLGWDKVEYFQKRVSNGLVPILVASDDSACRKISPRSLISISTSGSLIQNRILVRLREYFGM